MHFARHEQGIQFAALMQSPFERQIITINVSHNKKMKTLKSLWKYPTVTFEQILSKSISWFKTTLFFGCNGVILIYYIMKAKGLINVETFANTMASILTMLSVGMIYGIIANYFIGYSIKFTGSLFNAKNDLKKIYNALAWTSFPESIAVYILIVSILMARIILTNENVSLQLTLSFLVVIFMMVQAIISIWRLILIYKGLKVAQGLNSRDTILNYLSGALIFGVINYFLIIPYLY